MALVSFVWPSSQHLSLPAVERFSTRGGQQDNEPHGRLRQQRTHRSLRARYVPRGGCGIYVGRTRSLRAGP